MPAIYEKMGIRFLYPDNWTLDEDAALHGDQTVSVYSPGGAFWSIALHDASTDPAELAKLALQVIKSEYPDSESEPANETIGDQPMVGYNVNFFYLDLTSTALIRSYRTPAASYMVLCQAEDREFVTLAPVFQAITISLIRGE